MQEKFCTSLKEFGLQQNWRAQHFLQGLRRELQTLMSSSQRFCAPLRPSHTKVEERSGNWSPEQDFSGKSFPRCPGLSEGRWEGGGIRGRVLGGSQELRGLKKEFSLYLFKPYFPDSGTGHTDWWIGGIWKSAALEFSSTTFFLSTLIKECD